MLRWPRHNVLNQFFVTVGETEPEITSQKVTSSKNYTPSTNKKKLPRVHKSSISELQRKRYESVNSNSDLDTNIEGTNIQKASFDDLEQHTEVIL